MTTFGWVLLLSKQATATITKPTTTQEGKRGVSSLHKVVLRQQQQQQQNQSSFFANHGNTDCRNVYNTRQQQRVTFYATTTIAADVTKQLSKRRLQHQQHGSSSSSFVVAATTSSSCICNSKYNSHGSIRSFSSSSDNKNGTTKKTNNTNNHKNDGTKKKNFNKYKKHIANDDVDTEDDDDDDVDEGEENGLPYKTMMATGVQLTHEEIEKIIAEQEAILEQEQQSKIVKNWKPGMRKRPLQLSYTLKEFEYELEPEKFTKRWTLLDKRCGALAIKIGMLPVYDPVWGVRYPCTVLYLDNNIVLNHKTIEQNGYSAIQIGAGERKLKNVGVSVLGQYKHITDFIQMKRELKSKKRNQNLNNENNNGSTDNQTNNNDPLAATDVDDNDNDPLAADDNDNDDATVDDTESTSTSTTTTTSMKGTMKCPPYVVREFRVTDETNFIPVGCSIHASHFVPGQNVDVAGTSKGKGFQGGMKRHNFKGMPASHGTSLSHRAIGSTGQCQDPGRVFKGKKMPGRMGNERVTVQNLRILKIDRGRNLVYVVGAVPGQNGSFVEIRDSVKKPLWNRPDKVGTTIVNPEDAKPPLPTFPYDPTIDGSGKTGYEMYMPMPTNDPLAPDFEEGMDHVGSSNYTGSAGGTSGEKANA